jgi:hypothetical protein
VFEKNISVFFLNPKEDKKKAAQTASRWIWLPVCATLMVPYRITTGLNKFIQTRALVLRLIQPQQTALVQTLVIKIVRSSFT